MPASFKPFAIARNDSAPPACSSPNDRSHIASPGANPLMDSLRRRRAGHNNPISINLVAPLVFADDISPRTAQLFAIRLSSSQRLLGPISNHAGLKFGNGSHLLEHEPASRPLDLRQISETHINVRLQQLRKEGNGPGQAIHLAHHDGCTVQVGRLQRDSQLGTVGTAALKPS